MRNYKEKKIEQSIIGSRKGVLFRFHFHSTSFDEIAEKFKDFFMTAFFMNGQPTIKKYRKMFAAVKNDFETRLGKRFV